MSKTRPVSDFTESLINTVSEEVEAVSLYDWDHFNASKISEQMRELFKHIDYLAKQSEPSSTNQENSNSSIGYSIHVDESRITNAGKGVFLRARSSIPPGTVLALYPGIVHISSNFRNVYYEKQLLPDPDLMLMSRVDGCVIDARTADQVPRNPYAIAQYINHCGQQRPNVIQVTYDFPDNSVSSNRFPPANRKYIPNVYAKFPAEYRREVSNCYMKSIAIISSQIIDDGEELLLDYKLDLNSENLPEWYVAYDRTDSRLRWKVSSDNESL
jgi:hypothetical protein